MVGGRFEVCSGDIGCAQGSALIPWRARALAIGGVALRYVAGIRIPWEARGPRGFWRGRPLGVTKTPGSSARCRRFRASASSAIPPRGVDGPRLRDHGLQPGGIGVGKCVDQGIEKPDLGDSMKGSEPVQLFVGVVTDVRIDDTSVSVVMLRCGLHEKDIGRLDPARHGQKGRGKLKLRTSPSCC